ncbi:beta-ketoacyl-[acyl-carrier-protein] synthase family protein [Pseudomonas sp. CAU 1711]|uniref:beta-ketoacyl-[acyl-carrier-protein] synthase family protein n=1 Tax=Pseudomonas sp. CAU 1711 TaxID=3140356 RepID=UPI003261C0FE
MVQRKRVVVTGMGVLTALGNTVEAFREGLFAEKAAIGASQHFSHYYEDALASEVQQQVDYPGIAAERLAELDRTALWGYKVGRDALENAGLLGDPLLERTSLVVGVSSASAEAIMPLIEGRPEEFNPRKMEVCGNFSAICPVVTSLLGLKGGFELVATACTASTNAIGIGFDQIQNSKSPVALIVGSDPVYLPTFAGFYALKAMREEPCCPFSGTPGMSIGEGAGALVLEEYEHAKARGATIYGEIIGYATSSDAHHETAPDPRAEGATLVMRAALRNAGIGPEAIGYINAHGTGTEANDRAETLAMKKVFPNIAEIPVSSTKSYFGHNIGSAGIIEMIACLTTLPAGKVLPTLNFSTPRTGCDLNYVPNHFQEHQVGLFMKNNYAFGGNNCSLIASVTPETAAPTEYRPRRVAITGFGALSSLGYGAEQIAENIRNGVDGSLLVSADSWLGGEGERDLNQLLKANPAMAERLAGVTEADLRAMQFRAHEVRGIEPRKHVKNFDSRKASRIGTHGLLALEQALQSGGRKVRHGDTDVALIMGMSKGPQATIARYAQSLHPDPKRARTFEFPSALMNSTATFCAITKGLKGYNTTLSTGYNAGLGALLYGYELVRQGLQPQALVGGAEENAYSAVLMSPAAAERLSWSEAADAFQVYGASPSGFTLGEGAAVALLEDLDAARARGAEVLGEVIGYGRSCDAAYPGESGLATGNAMIAAIHQALAEAGLQPGQVDLICGTSWGTRDSAEKELGALRAVFGALAAEVPLVNYNGHFGFVESAAGLLNLSQVLQALRSGEIAPIPHTREFCADDIAFVRQPLRREVRHALVLGASDGGNNYALLVRKDG